MNTEPDATPINEPLAATHTAQVSTPATPLFNLAALRLPSNYGATLGVKKVLAAVPIRKPRRGEFFRVHPDEKWSFVVYTVEVDREFYVVGPDIADVLSSLVRPTQLHAAIDRTDNSWHESRAQAVERAKTAWVRMDSNMQASSYDIYVAMAELAEPIWPDIAAQELFEVAFRGRVISDETHPIVQAHLGKV